MVLRTLLTLWCLLITGMGLVPPASALERLTVYTVNYPLTYFCERIGGNLIEVVFPAPADLDPAFWFPGPATISDYQKGDLIILNGAGYAKWTRKVSLPLLRTVDTSKSFADQFIKIDTNVTHSHGPQGDHSHSGTAFTTWLDFSLAARQAESIYRALSRKLPAHEAELKNNFDSLKTDLLLLDEQLRKMTAARPELALLASHPIYQYLARRYQLNLKMVMWEPDADPGEKEWLSLQALLENHRAQWLLWEDTPLPESSARLEQMGVRSVVFSPCFNRPEQGDFLSVMRTNIRNLEPLFK